MYSIHFTENNKKLCLSLHKSNAKDSEIVATQLHLANI